MIFANVDSVSMFRLWPHVYTKMCILSVELMYSLYERCSRMVYQRSCAWDPRRLCFLLCHAIVGVPHSCPLRACGRGGGNFSILKCLRPCTAYTIRDRGSCYMSW